MKAFTYYIRYQDTLKGLFFNKSVISQIRGRYYKSFFVSNNFYKKDTMSR